MSELTPEEKKKIFEEEKERIEAQEKISFLTHKRETQGVVFPIAAFSENSGTLINEDGIEQKCEQAVYKNTPSPTLIELLKGVQA